MTIHKVSPDYQQTVGAMNEYRRANRGKEAGDPSRAAQILIDIVNHPEPPLRLLLGAGAVAAAEKVSEARAAEAARWSDVSRSADFPAEDTDSELTRPR